MESPQNLNLFTSRGRSDALHAVSLTLLAIRSQDWTCAKLGKVLDCHPDTVERASNEETMLGFESIMRLCQAFPVEAAPVRHLLDGPSDPPTTAQRIERIQRELDTLRKELAA